MINEVRIFKPDGKLKKVISCKTVRRKADQKLYEHLGRMVRKGVNLNRIAESAAVRKL